MEKEICTVAACTLSSSSSNQNLCASFLVFLAEGKERLMKLQPLESRYSIKHGKGGAQHLLQFFYDGRNHSAKLELEKELVHSALISLGHAPYPYLLGSTGV